jgi:hypothetical protein
MELATSIPWISSAGAMGSSFGLPEIIHVRFRYGNGMSVYAPHAMQPHYLKKL